MSPSDGWKCSLATFPKGRKGWRGGDIAQLSSPTAAWSNWNRRDLYWLIEPQIEITKYPDKIPPEHCTWKALLNRKFRIRVVPLEFRKGNLQTARQTLNLPIQLSTRHVLICLFVLDNRPRLLPTRMVSSLRCHRNQSRSKWTLEVRWPGHYPVLQKAKEMTPLGKLSKTCGYILTTTQVYRYPVHVTLFWASLHLKHT